MVQDAKNRADESPTGSLRCLPDHVAVSIEECCGCRVARLLFGSFGNRLDDAKLGAGLALLVEVAEAVSGNNDIRTLRRNRGQQKSRRDYCLFDLQSSRERL